MSFLASTGSLLIDGIAYGMVLFLISAGLTVTLGIMRVVNLAHCGFAMIGGYAALALVQRWGVSFLAALVAGTAFSAAAGAVLERTLYRWIYATGELGQMLMTIGLAFVMVASVNLVFGSSTHALPLPEWLSGAWYAGPISVSVYRAFLIGVSVTVAALLWLVLELTVVGAKLRAAVDNASMARCVGINVPQVFACAFVGGCALAALGGIIGGQLLPLEPWYALRFLVPVLMVVAVGGLGSLKGSFFAALMLGVVDTFGRYYAPALGAFVIYLAVVLSLLLRPDGLFARS
ncbi:MAG: branched-chain amino acid ABC transporter permease [Xanthobacteraceae bacterium]